MNKGFLIFFACCVFFAENTFAQENNQSVPTGFDFFFNAGMYKGHKFNADYYRGVPDNLNKRYGDPDIDFVLYNRYRRDEILALVRDNNRGVIVDENNFPKVSLSNMHYNLAFYFEIGARYRFNESLMLSFLFGQTRLTASGDASFGFLGTGSNLDVGNIVYLKYPLMGKERRTFFQAHVTCLFHTVVDYIFPFIEFGGHLNSAKVLSADLIVEKRFFDMINRYGEGYHYDPSISAPKINPHIGGVGYGFLGGFGIRIAFSEWAAVEPVVQVSFDKLNLSSFGKIRPNYSFMIRLVVGDRIFANK